MFSLNVGRLDHQATNPVVVTTSTVPELGLWLLAQGEAERSRLELYVRGQLDGYEASVLRKSVEAVNGLSSIEARQSFYARLEALCASVRENKKSMLVVTTDLVDVSK